MWGYGMPVKSTGPGHVAKCTLRYVKMFSWKPCSAGFGRRVDSIYSMVG